MIVIRGLKEPMNLFGCFRNVVQSAILFRTLDVLHSHRGHVASDHLLALSASLMSHPLVNTYVVTVVIVIVC